MLGVNGYPALRDPKSRTDTIVKANIIILVVKSIIPSQFISRHFDHEQRRGISFFGSLKPVVFKLLYAPLIDLDFKRPIITPRGPGKADRPVILASTDDFNKVG